MPVAGIGEPASPNELRQADIPARAAAAAPTVERDELSSDEWGSVVSFLKQRELTKMRLVSKELERAASYAVNSLTVRRREELAQALTAYQFNRPLSLDIHSIALLPDDLQLLAQDSSIVSLNVADCNVDDAGAQMLAASDSIAKLRLGYASTEASAASRRNQIGDVGIQALATRNVIKWLDLSHSACGIDGARALGQNKSIERLDLSECNLSDAHVVEIANNKTISSLILAYNRIGEFGVSGIAALAGNTSIKQLSLRGNFIEAEAAEILGRSTSIAHLDLSDTGIEDGILHALLATNNSLKTLHLNLGYLGHGAAVTLSMNRSIAALSLLACDGIGAAGLALIASNTELRWLCLDAAFIGDAGAAAIAGSRSLTELQLEENRLTDDGAAALARNTSIVALDLTSNAIGDEGAIALAGNHVLRHLDLSMNEIGDDGAVALANNTTLTSLSLPSTRIGERGALALAANRNITSLDLSGNDIGPVATHALEAVRAHYTSLAL